MTYKYGIDFGTTNSSIAVRFTDEDEREHTIVYQVKNNNPQEVLPSMLLIGTDGTVTFGDDLQDACNQLANDKEYRKNHKLLRKIKIKLEDEGTDYKYRVGNKEFSIIDLIAVILRELRIKAEKIADEIDGDINGVVMGVPVQYGDLQKNVLKKALLKAGYYSSIDEADRLTEFVSEPVAVAVHYGLNLENDKNVLVFDFGGGTLDVAIMNLRQQIGSDHLHPHETIAKDRITLGGEEINRQFFINCICGKYGIDLLNKVFTNNQRLSPAELWDYLFDKPEYLGFINKVEQCKWELSAGNVARFSYSNQGLELLEKKIYRDEFEDAIEESLEQIQDLVSGIIESCIDSGRIEDKYDIDFVIVSGGSSMIPAVQQILIDEFGKAKVVAKSFSNDEAIKKLKGHAIKESEVLTSIVRGLAAVGARQDTVVEDVVDSDYGLWDGVEKEFIPVIYNGTKVSDTVLDKLSGDGIFEEVECPDVSATSVKAEIYQKNISGLSKLGTITIKNPGGKKYKIYMQVDNKKGTLEVSFYDIKLHKWMDDIPLDGRVFEIN